ncbi:hypothetical protein FHR81_003170 [Actinoalloteichus hoggarensis]|uniref:Uncharacterized protein n=1 Tax=Actinoalloteichus hoggarensis TaxID=1470176 RepID=A0A221W6K6_9PSEU|nr:hypothetical protein [Actinoalloteichus hoggarensis]ASO21528.1 hypothetical protein AHOG_19530 [Actinoalloteichus hoggarensis]MBB5922118.1 hypothetical protein [Actinoalloteichus hoggarensis]
MNGRLRGHGRLPWDHAREVLADHTCLWIDHDGIHLGPAPTEAPFATHLWARHDRDHRYSRLRIDDEHAYPATLDLTEHASDHDDGEPVTVHRRTARLRPPRSTAHTLLTALAVDLLEIPGTAPITFLHFEHQPTPDAAR